MIIDENLVDKKIYITEIEGDAMIAPEYPRDSIYPGDTAVTLLDVEPKSGNTVLVETNGGCIVRQLFKDGANFVLQALNPKYPMMPLTKETEIVGVVYEIRRKKLVDSAI